MTAFVGTLFVPALLAGSLTVLAAPACTWCEAGACRAECSVEQDVLRLSLSDAVSGRGFPYWKASGAPGLGVRRPDVDVAIIVHHGDDRNGNEYLCYMINAVAAAGRLSTALVLSPQVYEDGDAGLDKGKHIWWDADRADDGKRNWKWGGNSTASLAASISSFQVLDEMVTALASRDSYPNLRRVVIAGHSAGGQIVQRYALFNRVDPLAGLQMEYYAANPSTATYLNASRPVRSGASCGFCDNTSIPARRWRFAVPGASDLRCPLTYNLYGYGLEGTLPPYLAAATPEAAVAGYRHRSVVYVSGESDVCSALLMKDHHCCSNDPDDGGIDASCEANAQGWCRMARLHAFLQHVRSFYADDSVHSLLSVPGVGHNGCAVFQSPEFAKAALISGSERDWQQDHPVADREVVV